MRAQHVLIYHLIKVPWFKVVCFIYHSQNCALLFIYLSLSMLYLSLSLNLNLSLYTFFYWKPLHQFSLFLSTTFLFLFFPLNAYLYLSNTLTFYKNNFFRCLPLTDLSISVFLFLALSLSLSLHYSPQLYYLFRFL